MTPQSDARVHIVDDDSSVRDALSWLLRTRRLLSECHEGAESFLSSLGQPLSAAEPKVPSCLLLDVRMPGMSGLALFEQLIAQPWQSALPVIFLSGHADVPTAVDAVKRGAFDFCEKPFSDNALVDRVEQALQRSAEVLALRRAQQELAHKLEGLTEREQEVMRLVLDGMPNKLVADALHISVRTVEVHRARVFEKMGVKSAVELANVLRGAGEPK